MQPFILTYTYLDSQEPRFTYRASLSKYDYWKPPLIQAIRLF